MLWSLNLSDTKKLPVISSHQLRSVTFLQLTIKINLEKNNYKPAVIKFLQLNIHLRFPDIFKHSIFFYLHIVKRSLFSFLCILHFIIFQSVVSLKTWHHTHRNFTLTAIKTCLTSMMHFPVWTYSTIWFFPLLIFGKKVPFCKSSFQGTLRPTTSTRLFTAVIWKKAINDWQTEILMT